MRLIKHVDVDVIDEICDTVYERTNCTLESTEENKAVVKIGMFYYGVKELQNIIQELEVFQRQIDAGISTNPEQDKGE